MSSYIDHYESQVQPRETADGEVAFRLTGVIVHSWADYTQARLNFLYPGRDHDAAQAADVEAWNRLGRKARAA